MITTLRRLFWLALLAGAGYALWATWQRNQTQQPAAPEWPPVDPPSPAPAEPSGPDAVAASFAAVPAEQPDNTDPGYDESTDSPAAASDAHRWVDPLDDGGCPEGYPIKANDNSGIFHVPGGRFYDRTGAERCYARTEDAEADGYRASKS